MQRVISLSLVVIGFGMSLGIGYYIGNRKAERYGLQILEQQMAHTLDMNIQQLSYIRTEAPEEAVRLMEETVDKSVTVMPHAGFDTWLEPQILRSMGRAKTYRGLYAAGEEYREQVEKNLRNFKATVDLGPGLARLVSERESK